MRDNKNLVSLGPERSLYLLRERLWANDQNYVTEFVRLGGPALFADPVRHPGTLAEMQLALHSYYVGRNDLTAAANAKSSAIAGLLLLDPGQVYGTCKILVRLLTAFLDEGDIVGAFQLHGVVNAYIDRSLAHQSPLYADYLATLARLYSYTSANAVTLSILADTSRAFDALDIQSERRDYELSIANSLSSTALILDEQIDKAGELHAMHPMQKNRDAILKRGQFDTYQEFFFAVSDVFLAAVSGSSVDSRWQALFERQPKWQIGEVELANVNSYRNFSLGLLSLANGKRSDAIDLLTTAARQRIDNFERVLKVNFDEFELPSVVDRIVISVALMFVGEVEPTDAANLILRGSEILSRTVRHALGDEAALYAAQPDDRSRRNAQAYLSLIRQKRDWELRSLKARLDAPETISKGALITQYDEAVATLTDFRHGSNSDATFDDTDGLPAVADIQRALGADERFITYFDSPLGLGRLCIDKTSTTFSVDAYDTKAAARHIRLLEFATTASYAANPALDSQFPVESSLFLNKLLFGGLQTCLKSGAHLTMVLPGSLSGVPVAALLSEPPPHLGGAYDLAAAKWLIKDFDFSFAISARHYLSAKKLAKTAPAAAGFLGIGNPALNSEALQVLEGSFAAQPGASHPSIAQFKELPDTADELRRAAATFDKHRSVVLLGVDATEMHFRAKPLLDFDVIHFATHAYFDEGPAGSAGLILTPSHSNDAFDDGILSAAEISRLPLRARLVVLSACNSARYGQNQATVAVNDLQAAFAAAGTPTLLASLWPVDSATTATIITEFFTQWRTGRSGGAAQSLATALRAYLAKTDRAHQHPRFWAPFMIAGDGTVSGAVAHARQSTPPRVMALEGFAGNGIVVGATKLGANPVLSVTARDGERYAGVVTQLKPDGNALWRTGSRDIWLSRIATVGSDIWASGYKSTDSLVPFLRVINSAGRVRSDVPFPGFAGYAFVDLAPSADGAAVIALPIPNLHQDGVLLDLDRNAKIRGQYRFASNATWGAGPNAGGFVRDMRDRIVVVLNQSPAFEIDPKRMNALGLPSVCQKSGGSRILEFDHRTLTLLQDRFIDRFQVRGLAAWNGQILLGGQQQDRCSSKGKAAILKLTADGPAIPIWSYSSIFSSSVWGMAASDKLSAALTEERMFDLREVEASDSHKPPKLIGESPRSIWNGSLLRFSKDVQLVDRMDLSAGMNIVVVGAEQIGKRVLLYGSLGGRPAVAWQ